jgi:hypothetical protein
MTVAPERAVTVMADTGYLLCFGSIPQGLKHLRAIFGNGMGVPPAVRRELSILATNMQRPHAIRSAAARFVGRESGILVDCALEHVDVPERDLVLMHLEQGTLPVGPPPAPATTAQEGRPAVTGGPNAGEAEAIAICVRVRLPLLMNDGKATKYAVARRLRVEPAGASLRHLVGRQLTAREAFKLYRGMVESVGDAGIVISGYLWFRQPVK